jgi:magnesium chelatase subunit H
VSAPLLIQNLGSWRKDGVQGLQQVVLQALPELDGAIDNVVLGGLVGDTIGLVPERVRRLGSRLLGWIQLRRTPPSQRKVAVMLYGFPPNVGAVGTAALLNVPSSLEALLKALAKEGYNLGDFPEDIDGEALVAALKVINQDSVIARGYEHLPETLEHASSLGEECSYRVANPRGLAGAVIAGAGIPAVELGKYLSRRKTRCVENAWGELERYRGIGTSSGGDLVVAGLQLGNIFIGVQPLLGVEGDPMRLLFQKDLTPHPQYCAFYEWLKQDYGAHAVIHCGMHGTYEWLPEAQTAQQTWPDLLMGYMPNLYIYAASESLSLQDNAMQSVSQSVLIPITPLPQIIRVSQYWQSAEVTEPS